VVLPTQFQLGCRSADPAALLTYFITLVHFPSAMAHHKVPAIMLTKPRPQTN
jgi:hypothetical protein